MSHILKFTISEKRKNPAYPIKHIVRVLTWYKFVVLFPYIVTRDFNISGVIGSFLMTGQLVIRLDPSLVDVTSEELHGSGSPANLCVQLIAYAASSILDDELQSVKYTKYSDTCKSEAGNEEILGWNLEHHWANLLKAYLYFFTVLSALDLRQISGKRSTYLESRGSCPASDCLSFSHLPFENTSTKCTIPIL